MCTGSSKRPSARSACATASSPIPSASSDPPARYLEKSFLDTEAAEDRPPQGGALAGASRRRRHDLDGRGGFLRPRRVLHPVALLGVRLGLRAAAHRRADAEPRRELLAREGRREPAAARPQAVPHAQSGARGAARRPRDGLRRDGRRRPAAIAGRAVHPPRALSRAAGAGGRPAALAARPHLGLVAHEPAARVALFRGADRPAVIRRSRCRGIAGRLFRHDGPCRRRGAASGRHARRRARPARRWRRGGQLSARLPLARSRASSARCLREVANRMPSAKPMPTPSATIAFGCRPTCSLTMSSRSAAPSCTRETASPA